MISPVEIIELIVSHLYTNTQLQDFVPREQVVYTQIVPPGMKFPVLAVIATPLFARGENLTILEYELQLRVYLTATPSQDYPYNLFTKLNKIIDAALEGQSISDASIVCKNITKLTGSEIITSGTPEDEQIAYVMRYRTVVQNV